MEDTSFDIAFDYEGIHYKGWVTPAEAHNAAGKPRSFHVVLNDTLFGNLAYHDDQWTIDEQRPAGMVELVGAIINKKART
jgi:hypothetical protein